MVIFRRIGSSSYCNTSKLVEDLNHLSTSPEPLNAKRANRLLELLFWSKLVGVTTLLLSAVGGTGRETGIALSADHLVTVELGSKGLQRWLDDTTTETEDEMKS